MAYYFAPVFWGGQGTAGQLFYSLMQSLSDRAGARVFSKASSLMGLVAWVGRTQLGFFRPFSTWSLHNGSQHGYSETLDFLCSTWQVSQENLQILHSLSKPSLGSHLAFHHKDLTRFRGRRCNSSLEGRGVKEFVAYFKTTSLSSSSKPGTCGTLEDICVRQKEVLSCKMGNPAYGALSADLGRRVNVAPWRTKPVCTVAWGLEFQQQGGLGLGGGLKQRASFCVVMPCGRDSEQQEWMTWLQVSSSLEPSVWGLLVADKQKPISLVSWKLGLFKDIVQFTESSGKPKS